MRIRHHCDNDIFKLQLSGIESETGAKDRWNQAKLELINKQLENRASKTDSRENEELATEYVNLCERKRLTKASPKVSIT